MKKLIITTIFVLLFGLLFSRWIYCNGDKGMTINEYQIVKQSYEQELNLPFVYNGGSKAHKIYKNYIFGVNILTIHIDEKLQKKMTFNHLIDEIDDSSLELNDNKGYLYEVMANKFYDDYTNWKLVFRKGKSENIDLIEYSIPRKKSEVVIKYTINTPKEEKLDPCILRIIIE